MSLVPPRDRAGETMFCTATKTMLAEISGFHHGARQVDEVQGRERQGDGVRHGEGGDDLDQVPERRRAQHQGTDEEQVIG